MSFQKFNICPCCCGDFYSLRTEPESMTYSPWEIMNELVDYPPYLPQEIIDRIAKEGAKEILDGQKTAP